MTKEAKLESGWRSVREDPPPEDRWVLVWWQGQVALAKHVRTMAPFPWIVLPPGNFPTSPYPAFFPEWWTEALLPPSGATEAAWEGYGTSGEPIVRWRGSVSDLATDLRALLSVEQLAKLVECFEPEQGIVAAAGRASGSPSPVPMLLWCPQCNERHIDRGEFATRSHKTHTCQFCGMHWQPSLVPTLGVQFLPGCRNEAERPERPERSGSGEDQGSGFGDPAERPQPSGPWCPATKGACERPCVGAECLLWNERNPSASGKTS